MNFGLAAEQANGEGLAVKMVIVGDDVAVNAGEESDGSITGRRGLRHSLVHKCAGQLLRLVGRLTGFSRKLAARRLSHPWAAR